MSFDLGMCGRQRFSANIHYQQSQGLSKAFVRHSKHCTLGQSMFSCAKLCDTNLEQLPKLLHSLKRCTFSQRLAHYFTVVLFQSSAMCTFCNLGCSLGLSSVEYFHPTNVGSFGHPCRNCYPAIVGWMLDDMLDRLAQGSQTCEFIPRF